MQRRRSTATRCRDMFCKSSAWRYQKLLQPHGVNVVEGAKGVCHQRSLKIYFSVSSNTIKPRTDCGSDAEET